MKVVVEATPLFYDKLREDGWADPLQSVHDSTSALKRANADTIVHTDCNGTDTCHDTPTHKDKCPRVSLEASSRSSLGRKAGDMPQMITKLPEETNGPSVKAAKNNDAKVKEQQWDVWSVNNFYSESGEIAKICIPGSYCTLKHGKLFGSLCCLALCWYC